MSGTRDTENAVTEKRLWTGSHHIVRWGGGRSKYHLVPIRGMKTNTLCDRDTGDLVEVYPNFLTETNTCKKCWEAVAS